MSVCVSEEVCVCVCVCVCVRVHIWAIRYVVYREFKQVQ